MRGMPGGHKPAAPADYRWPGGDMVREFCSGDPGRLVVNSSVRYSQPIQKLLAGRRAEVFADSAWWVKSF